MSREVNISAHLCAGFGRGERSCLVKLKIIWFCMLIIRLLEIALDVLGYSNQGIVIAKMMRGIPKYEVNSNWLKYVAIMASFKRLLLFLYL